MKGELAAWLRRAGTLEDTPTDIVPPYLFELSGEWQQAADSWQTMGCPYERALILGWYGGEPEQRESLTIFQRLGAIPAMEALRRRMLALGIRGVPRGARPSAQEHPFGLTRREAQILGLMHDGLRNAANAGPKSRKESSIASDFIDYSKLVVEVRIEDANLGDPRDRQPVSCRGVTHRLRTGTVVDTVGPHPIRRDVGMHPSDAILRIVVDHRAAETCSRLFRRDFQAFWKLSLYQVSRHRDSSW